MAKTRKPPLDRQVWIDAARTALIEFGIRAVRVEPLAKRLGVTTGSFYWHFGKLADLLEAVARDWEVTNNAGLLNAVAAAGSDPLARMEALADAWIEETGFSPAYDSAMRDWARIDPAIEAKVRRVDNRRIALIKEIFLALGHQEQDAFVRARIAYFHQVGYYAMRIVESRSKRRGLKPIYLRALVGERGR